MGEPVNCTHQELCTFLQALGAGYLPTSCSGINPSAPSKSIAIASKSWRHGKKTGAFPGFQSLTMCKSSTGTPGEDSSTSSLAAFPARTSAQPEKAQESKVSDPACGWKWPESSMKHDRDSRSWKTRQCSVLGGLEEFSETWPRWGSMRNGECWEQPMWGHLTDETESGLRLSTPTASMTVRSEKFREGRLPAPSEIARWPTPTASQARSEGMILQMRKQVEAGTISQKEAELMIGGSLTPKRLHSWPTPQASDNRDRGNMSDPSIKRRVEIGKQIGLSTAVKPSKASGSLNPTWVEWLMNWPLNWTSMEEISNDNFKCWKEASAAKVSCGGGAMRPLWWYSEPPEASQGSRHQQQQPQQCGNTLRVMSREASCAGEVERSQQREVLPELRGNVCLSESQADDMQQKLWEQVGVEAPRVTSGVTSRVDRLKAIGNGQVPQCAAAAFIEGYNRLCGG